MGVPDYNEFLPGKFAWYVTPTGTGLTTPNNITPIIDFPTLVSLGLITGYTHDSKTGTNDAVPASTFVILSNVTSAAFPVNFPAAAQQMQVVSTSANDTGAGTGAQQVKITYLTTPAAGFSVNTEFVTLNGLTPVLTVNTNIYRVEEIEVSRVGTGLFAAGNISLQSVGGATTFEQINAGGNFGQTCIHFCPGGFKSILYGVTKGSSTAGGTIFVVRMTEQFQGNNIAAHGIERLEMGNFAIHTNLIPPHVIKNPNNLEMYIAIFVKGRASNQQATGTIHFVDSPI